MAEIYDKLGSVRPPKVHIRFDVHTEGAEPKNDLPFVVGVMGDFSGDPTGELRPLPDRKFVKIDRDNFDTVMTRMMPGLNLRVKNTLADDDTEFAVSLKFDSMRSFEPGNIIKQVEPLKKLMAIRDKLRDLMTKADRSPKLEAFLEKVLQNEDGALDALAAELGIESPTGESKNKNDKEETQ
jgi:type VI secretion system protein ImpB